LQYIFLVVRICAFRIESVREGLEDGPIKKTTYERITKVLVPNNAILLEALNTGLRKVVKVVFCFFSDSEGWFGAAGRIQNGSVWVFIFFPPFRPSSLLPLFFRLLVTLRWVSTSWSIRGSLPSRFTWRGSRIHGDSNVFFWCSTK